MKDNRKKTVKRDRSKEKRRKRLKRKIAFSPKSLGKAERVKVNNQMIILLTNDSI